MCKGRLASTVICWIGVHFVILGVSGLFCHFCTIFDRKILLTNKVDPDHIPHHVAFDLGLHCFPMTLLRGFQVRMGFTY